jgi:hypothetical protein
MGPSIWAHYVGLLLRPMLWAYLLGLLWRPILLCGSVRPKVASAETEYSARATETESENSIFLTIFTIIFSQKMKMNFLLLI